MRRIVFLGLLLALAGCGGDFNEWHHIPFVVGPNMHQPAGDSENMQRAMGEPPNVQPLTPEPGDIWPGPIKPPPTLQDLENQSGQPEQPLPPVGSSTPPATTPPNFPPLPSAAPSAILPSQSTATGLPNATKPSPAGQLYQTNKGPAVTTGGTSNYQTITIPGGSQSIVVPNGNGTSTIIHPDGTVETVPTPK